MPLLQTSGNVTADGYGGGAAAVPNYIEDVFSTYLYAGNGSIQTITNGIDLSGKGGLVWQKSRTSGFAYTSHILHSPNVTSGTNQLLLDSATTAGAGVTSGAYTYLSTGFSINGGFNDFGNASGQNYASWTFRKQPKFFDVVTYTGNATTRTIAHNLGSVPGCIIIKRTDDVSDWTVYHRGVSATIPADYNLVLNSTAARNSSQVFNFTPPTSTEFTIYSSNSVNASGGTFVAYLFAHDAGGFGLTGTDNVISCGSYVGSNTTFTTVTLGYEPQWVMIKRATGTTSAYTGWAIFDNMRGMPVSGNDNTLLANTSDAENPATANGSFVSPTATGFTLNVPGSNLTNTSETYIYIAIRRGPMKVPTSGTSVFSPNTANASAGTPVVTNFPVDLSISVAINGDTRYFSDRLRGVNSPGLTANQPWIASNSTGAELTNASIPRGWDNTQILLPPYYAGGPTVWWNMRRAPSFFDEVCYTGTGTATTVAHNLGVVPELMIVKTRSLTGQDWAVYSATLGNTGLIYLNQAAAANTGYGHWNSTSPTSTVFSLGGGGYNMVNGSGATYVNYLFASCPGVSKVGSYTGNGTTQTINCGFTGGARFVLIKRTDSTGDWYVYDTARGMTVLTDPYLLLNSTAAESATLGSVTTVSTGFAVNASILAAINTNGASYIFLAIA